jgi:hypothetical protein
LFCFIVSKLPSLILKSWVSYCQRKLLEMMSKRKKDRVLYI